VAVPDPERAEAERLVDFWTPLVVRLVSEAGVFATFGFDERTIEAVACDCDVDPGALRRMIRVLTARGVFEPGEHGGVRLTGLGRRFIPGTPGNIAGLANYKSFELHAWADAEHSLRTGEPSFVVHHGAEFFDWLADHPDLNERFNDTMRRRVSTMLDNGLPLMTWPDTGTVADIGGGTGALLERVLGPRPLLHGVLFDQPHVVAEATDRLGASPLAERIEFVGGSFFEAVPAGHDVYVLSNILHDWDDDRAVEILRRIHDAMLPGSRLVLFEEVLRDDGTPELGLLIDLHMLVLLGAVERTEPQWRALLERAGFVLAGITPTPGLDWIEARPAIDP
jgi:SAM-dependent methyltransferase